MFAAASPQPLATLDLGTLSVVAICIVALLGLLLLVAWLRQRTVPALAWWGSAYLIGASAIALWGSPSAPAHITSDIPEALAFVACGMIWNGVRLFQGRRLLPVHAFGGSVIWLLMCRMPGFEDGGSARIVVGVLIVASYTFVIGLELWRERRKSLYSRTAALVVPSLHAAIFLIPLVMRALWPDASASWLTVFALETIIYAVGAAFIVLVMVNDQHVHIYRNAASTDHLTGVMNRRAFMEAARTMGEQQGKLNEPVTLLMFDLDHFKSINDRFGHAVGDDALKLFAQVAQANMRTTDVFGRLGGEEFAAIVPEPMEVATKIADRLRIAFQAAGVTVGPHAVGATVSIGAATSYAPVTDVDGLIIRADSALYCAKRDGRNRVCVAEDDPSCELARLKYTARTLRAAQDASGVSERRAARAKRESEPVA